MHGELLTFWFEDAGPARWFAHERAFDEEIRRRFSALYEEAAAGRHDDWADSADGALALLILLDQFSRNLFRDSPRAFAMDAKALAVASQALARGFDHDTTAERRQFFYMPFMHSENIEDQRRCAALFGALEDGVRWLEYARRHMKIIERFGRFPHRNETLGRRNTTEEDAWLHSPEAVSF